MSRLFGSRLKSELALRIAQSMNVKGISNYEELRKKCNFNSQIHFHEIITGKRAITEENLIVISSVLDIPLDYFKRQMKRQVKYKVEEYIPVDEAILKEKRRKYNTEFQRRKRAKKEE